MIALQDHYEIMLSVIAFTHSELFPLLRINISCFAILRKRVSKPLLQWNLPN